MNETSEKIETKITRRLRKLIELKVKNCGAMKKQKKNHIP